MESLRNLSNEADRVIKLLLLMRLRTKKVNVKENGADAGTASLCRFHRPEYFSFKDSWAATA